MRLPVLLVMTVALSLLAIAAPRALATPSGPDGTILRQAAARLAHQPRGSVLRWLRSHHSVASAVIGRDGRTVDVSFRDGREMLILPHRLSRVRLPSPDGFGKLRPNARSAQSAGARAAVLEPFATELGLGSTAGDPEVNVLQQAGFRVDSAYDGSVSVSFMTGLAAYNVVYMHTHSGVTSDGDGVLATGQVANNDGSVGQYLADQTVITVGVAGDNTNLYYALTSRFFTLHVGRFASNSILFLNGCKLLPALTFWNALASRGAGVMLSWTDDATTQDDYLSAAAFFNFMGQGQSVDGALQSTKAAGYGTSSYGGVTATLGYHGNGSITLSLAAHGQGQQPTPTTVPTMTPRPTLTPVPTGTRPAPTATATAPSPTSTSTTTPLPLVITHLLKTVVPGKRQLVTVQSAPHAALKVGFMMPNHVPFSSSVTADTTGVATVSFRQPASMILRNNRTATVSVQLASEPSHEVTRSYTIGYGPIDIAVSASERHTVSLASVWVHTRARTRVALALRLLKKVTLHGTTGGGGWAHFTYRLPRGVHAGDTLRLTATARYGGKSHSTRSMLHFV